MDTEKNDLPPQFDASQALVDIHVQDNGGGIGGSLKLKVMEFEQL